MYYDITEFKSSTVTPYVKNKVTGLSSDNIKIWFVKGLVRGTRATT